MGREVEGPAVSSPVITLPENGLFIPSESEESHFLRKQPTSREVTTPLSFRAKPRNRTFFTSNRPRQK